MKNVQARFWPFGVVAISFVALIAQPTMAQESVAVRAAMVKGTIPADDPNAAVWNSAPVAQFPMSPQVHWQNRIQEVTVKDLKVRALHDGDQVAVLLEYADPTENPDDAAALEFMVGDKKAHFAHGQPMAQVEGGPVNIWFWKNKENKAVDMNAKGFGTLKAQGHQDVKAKGVYANGTWKVVFSRSPVNSSTSPSPCGMAERTQPETLWKRDRKRPSPPGGISAPTPLPIIPATCTRRWLSHWPWGSNSS